MNHPLCKKLKLSVDSWSVCETNLPENPMLRTLSDCSIGHSLSMTPLLRAKSSQYPSQPEQVQNDLTNETTSFFLSQQMISSSQKSLDNEDEKKPSLDFSLVQQKKSVVFYQISQNTLLKQLTQTDDRLFIIDCRFTYEYNTGHIKNALNYSNPFEVLKLLFGAENTIKEDIIIVMYCEFSERRSTDIAYQVRQYDRKRNAKLRYPDLFVLEGGFNKFSQNHQDYCDGEYLPMNSELYADECQQHITELNYNWKKLMTNEQCRFTRQRFPK